MVLPRKTAYVGETVPVEIRLGIDSRVRWQPEAMPVIPGEGFTKQKLPEPRQERGNKDGREVDVLVFRTAITPSKAGKIELGPIEIPYVAQVPRAQRNRPRGFLDDVFGDPFFSVNQRFKARAEAVELEQIKHRRLLQTVDTPHGELRLAASGFEMAHGSSEIRTPAPRLGEHSAEVLREAGYSDAQIDALVTAGVTSVG